jgi:hypothetical protein
MLTGAASKQIEAVGGVYRIKADQCSIRFECPENGRTLLAKSGRVGECGRNQGVGEPLGRPSELQSYTLNAQLLPGSDFANSIPPFVAGAAVALPERLDERRTWVSLTA